MLWLKAVVIRMLIDLSSLLTLVFFFLQPELAAQLKEAIRIQAEQRLIQQQQQILEHQPFVQDGQVWKWTSAALERLLILFRFIFTAALSAQLRSVLQSHIVEDRQNHRTAGRQEWTVQGAHRLQHVQGSGHIQSAQQLHLRRAQSVRKSCKSVHDLA